VDSSNENQYGKLFTTKVIVLDTEASPDKDYLSQIAWIIYSSTGVAEGAYCATLVAPDYPEFERTEVFTVGSSVGVPLVKKQGTLACVLEDLTKCVKGNSPLCLAAHNVEWDAGVIAEAERQTGAITGVPSLPRLCTMLATARDYGHGHYLTLAELHKLLFGQEHKNAHDALADAAACGGCLWFLARKGVFRGYRHAEAVAGRSRRPARADLWWQSQLVMSKMVRSARARAAWRERVSRGLEGVGGIDKLVLARIQRMPHEGYQLFLREYASMHSASAATYIKRALSVSSPEVVLKPETSWRCIAAYCAIAEVADRRELANLYLSGWQKARREIELRLGEDHGPYRQEIGRWFVIPDIARSELLKVCGGSLELLTKAEAEYKALGKWDDPYPLLLRCGSGDKSVCGRHEFKLPYGTLGISIAAPSIAKRVLAFLFG
jgi:hypothetical protein